MINSIRYQFNWISAVVGPLAGIDNVKLPDVTDCEPKVKTPTARLPWLELYIITESKLDKVSPVHEKLPDGVQYAVEPDVAGAVAFGTATPPAVYPDPLASPWEAVMVPEEMAAVAAALRV
jgi:hypothetical protein